MKPGSIQANFREAVNAHLLGDLEGAASLYQKVLSRAPAHQGTLNNLGAIHLQNKEWEAAAKCLQEALKHCPENGDVLNNLGVSYLETGQPSLALSCLQKALHLNPRDPEVHTNIGAALRAMGDLDTALAFHRKAVELDPAGAKGYNNLALVLKDQGDLDEAATFFRKALELNPGEEKFTFNLCETLVESGALAEAAALMEESVSRHPSSIITTAGAARVFIECGHWEKADPLLRDAAAHPFITAEADILRHLLLHVNGSLLDPRTVAALHLRCGELLCRDKSRNGGRKTFQFEGRFDDLPRIRIGYVSPDFNRHSVGWFFKEIVGNHDSSRFEIYCYSLSDRSDDVTEWIRARATRFRTLRKMPEREIAEQIYEDRIMILVDLAGYTRENRLEVFACRPAPVQVTAVGYPHGTGLTTMDYRITDRLSEGPSAQEEYRENLIFLDRFFLPLPVLEVTPTQITRERLRIEEDAVVFASFNGFHKLRPEVLRLWNEILCEVPNSHILFSFEKASCEYARRRVANYFTAGSTRIHFLTRTKTEEEHRGRYRLADLALDPFPYSGTTTSWEALSMSVPVITLKGCRHVQRTTFSLLSHLGLTELAAENPEDYCRIAKTLASDPERRNGIRDTLRSRIQTVTAQGNRAYVEQLEALYLTAWSRYRGK